MLPVPYTFAPEVIEDFNKNLPELGFDRAHSEDAAYDLRAAEDKNIWAGETELIRTGLRLALPDGYAGLVLSRSGLARDHNIYVPNAPGLIDAGYRGEVGVLLKYGACPIRLAYDDSGHCQENTDVFRVKRGDRIAQLLLVKVAELHTLFVPPAIFEFNESNTARGSGGFGSTGVS